MGATDCFTTVLIDIELIVASVGDGNTDSFTLVKF